MKTLHIMTWNTGLYLERTLQPIPTKYEKIINYVNDYLEKQNAICFLQEIPYCSNETWETHALFLQLQKDFPDNEYDIHYQLSTKKQIIMTVAIAKKGIFDKVNYTPFNTNRFLTVKHDDFTLTGVHVHSGKDNKQELLLLNRCDSDIILGDFNAGNYPAYEHQDLFPTLFKNHVCNCQIPTRVDPVTKHRKCLDHVFIKKEYVSCCKDLIVHENEETIKLSDHFPITFTLLLE